MFAVKSKMLACVQEQELLLIFVNSFCYTEAALLYKGAMLTRYR
jgi:hypothetical protein